MQLSFSHFLLLAAALGFQSALGAPCGANGICSRDVAQPVPRNALPEADQLDKHHLEERQVGPFNSPAGPINSPVGPMDSSSGSPAPVLPDRRDDSRTPNANPNGDLVPSGASAGNIVGSTTQPEAMMLLADPDENGMLPQ